jgi:hypothetical protein
MTSIEQLNEQIQNAQNKIIELQQKEAEEKAELKIKQTMFEPNILVLQKWLDTVNYNKIQIEKVKNIKTKHDEFMQKRYQGYYEACKKEGGNHPPGYSCEPIDKKLNAEYNKYWGPTATIGGKPTYIQDIETFEPALEKFNDSRNRVKVPCEFMIHFIEATHNMFLIQQKRIDELETKVKLISEKNNENFILKDNENSIVKDNENFTL